MELLGLAIVELTRSHCLAESTDLFSKLWTLQSQRWLLLVHLSSHTLCASEWQLMASIAIE
jgi:hypothetical protein